MKKNYFIAILALVVNFAIAQIEPTSYRGAFAASPTAPWTDSWTEFDPQNANYTSTKPVVVISADITANTTWSANNVYELNGTIFVRNNATLTIPAGTLIKSNATAASLIVTRGAKLNAIGTASSPIVFTSKNAAGSRNRGDWGGIVLLGKGRYNINNGVNYIEGISQTVETQFGGGLTPINDDNSGTLKYVRIEYAGYVFSPNNELNGLTMGACGSGTTIDYVQVSYSNDDSFEWFGGSVDCKHLVALAGLDDDFDTDNGYNGRVQFGLSIKDPSGFDISTSECFESDNSAGTGANVGNATTDAWKTSAIFTNFTCLGPVYRATLTTPATSVNNLHDKAARLRRATQLKVFNSLFLDFRRGLQFENDSVTNFTTGNTTIWQNNIIAGSTPIISSTTAIADKYTAGSNSSLAGTTTTTAATGTSLILVNPYPANSGSTTPPGYTGLDYRPGTDSPALSGASFTNAAFTGILTQVETASPIVTTPINYCKGAVAATLTAINAPGTTLRWYTALTGGTAALVPPTVATTTVGTKTYYVTQFNATTGVESTPRTAIVVNTLATPAVALGTITNGTGTAAITAIGQYVGTTTEVTYRVPLSTELGVTSYVWTLPLGVNSVSQTTDTTHAYLTVNFNNVPAGAETYGTIGVQAVNEAGCRGVVKTVALTKALPAAPAAITMTNGTTTTAITTFAPYMGTNTVLTLTPTAVPVATSYVWELPTGVNPVLGTVVSTTVRLYAVYPFLTTISSAPTAVGNVYYRVTETVYSSGIVTQTATRSVVGGTLANGVAVTAVNNAPVTNLTNEGATINPAFPILSTSSTSSAIQVDFAGVTSANTFNYSTTAAVPVSTNVLRIGVKSRNGVGVSTTPNTTLVNPTTTSTAKLLTLTAIAPAAPATVKLTNPALTGTAATTAITIISKYIGTNTSLLLSATASPLASSYEWELPTWVNVVSGNPLTDREITVNFAGNINAAAPAGVTSYYFGVRAKNGIGYSVTNNATLTPVTTSTAKLLKVTTSLPAIVATVTGQIVSLCGGPYSYTMTASPLANSYLITAPTNAVVTSASNLSNNSNVLTTSDLTFSVTYPAGFTVTTTTAAAEKSLVITSVNGVGNSSTNKVLALTTALGAVGAHTNSYVNPNTGVTGATLFGKCAIQTIAVPEVPYATSYVWTLPNGATGTSNTRTIDIDFAAVATPTLTTKVTVKVKAFNGCVYSAEKSILLTFDGITFCPDVRMASNSVSLDASQIYPNPTSDNFNIDLTSSISSEVLVTIYSMNGSVVKTNKIELNQGLNTINEDITSLSSGIYFVRLVNESNNETIVRKLVKR
ncbi:MAG: T9SS type A sorting domain-containing protein [Flavobacterium sp.]|uniref:T9SS type A sorting domain-containing protein n=1 Tax=Flavobacterium sp. TaxID=239 RepID=UPI003BE41BED